jgi:Flp pilus assembly protein TadG
MKLLANNKGQSIVEIGLMAPLLLIALYIPADFGIAYFTSHLTQNAVREAARIGAAKAPPFTGAVGATVKAEAINRLPTMLGNPSVTVTYYWDGTGSTCMQVVRVTVAGDYNFFLYQLMRILGMSAPDTMPISRAALMRYDYQPSDNSMPACTTASVTVT